MTNNEFKFSALRQFGSENLSFTATIHSEKDVLSPEEVQAQIKQISATFDKAFVEVQEREIIEKGKLAEASDRRREAVKKLDDALKLEMEAKSNAQITMKKAEKLSDKLTKGATASPKD